MTTRAGFELMEACKNMLEERYSQVLLELMTLDSEPALVLIQQTEAEIWI